jgi:hypothetical protein
MDTPAIVISAIAIVIVAAIAWRYFSGDRWSR